MKHNKDELRNSVDSIQYKADKTLENYHMTEEMIKKTNDEEMKSSLEAKNTRRVETLKNMKKEVKQKAGAKYSDLNN